MVRHLQHKVALVEGARQVERVTGTRQAEDTWQVERPGERV